MLIDFGWIFKGASINKLVDEYYIDAYYKTSKGFDKTNVKTIGTLDISDENGLVKEVDDIFKFGKSELGTWFEKFKKDAIRSTLIERKVEHIANAATYLHFFVDKPKIKTKENSSKETVRNTIEKQKAKLQTKQEEIRDRGKISQDQLLTRCKLSLNNLTDNELNIIFRNCDKIHKIFRKNRVVDLAGEFRPGSGKLSSVSRNIGNEFIRIGKETGKT